MKGVSGLAASTDKARGMRRNLPSLVLAAALLIGSAAGAATLSYTGQIYVGLGTMPGLAVPGAGTSVVNGSATGSQLSSFTMPSGVFGPVTTVVSMTAVPTIPSIRFTGVANLGGSFGPALWAGPPAGGAMGLSGLVKICVLFPGCIVSVPVPLTPTGGGAGLGIGGTATQAGFVNLTLQHAPWTLGTPALTIHNPGSSVTTPSLPGGFVSPASGGAAPGGTVQLVTVTKVFTSLAGSFPELPVFVVLTLNFAPEPGTLLLLGSGVVGLAIIGRRRSR
jgi:hypothetical protein